MATSASRTTACPCGCGTSVCGVLVYKQGKGTIEGCDIFANENAGVQISEDGDPTVRNCKIRDSKKGCGVWAFANGRGTIEGCDLTGNAEGAWDVASGCEVTRRGNREES